MLQRFAVLIAIVPSCALAQSTCPAVNFLAARTVNLKPTATSHIDVIRQSDGSYTGFEAADSSPYRVIAATPHFERQFAACLPHTIPAAPSIAGPNANPPGAGAQLQAAAMVSSGNYFKATIGNQGAAVYFDLFDSQDNLLSETSFSYYVNAGPGNRVDSFTALALADMNGDGNLDLVAVFDTNRINATIQGGVWIFSGHGDGTFGAGTRSILNQSIEFQAALTLAIADLNGDGRPDIVFAAPYGSGGAEYGPPVIALANGDGTFTTSAPSLSLVIGVTSVAIADLNGDGKPDIVAVFSNALEQYAPSLAILLGDGKGGFVETATQYSAALPTIYSSGILAGIAVGDLNGDGIPDIATAFGTILFGDGRGAFPVREDYTTTATGSVMIADIDGDGIPDIVFGNGNPDFLAGSAIDLTATVLFGSGKGAFVGTPVSGTALSLNNYSAFAIADFNGDGIPDMALPVGAKTALQLTVLSGTGNGIFPGVTSQTFAQSAGATVTYAIAADFNRDGKADLAILTGGGIQICLGIGNGTFTAPTPLSLTDDDIVLVAARDFNGDGIPDLAAWSASTLFVLLGKGDGTFSPAALIQAVTSPAITFGDFNGDGKLDIAIANASSASVSVLLGKGDGTFPNTVKSVLPSPALGAPPNFDVPELNTMAAADFNGDGRLDLVVGLASYEMAVLAGQGNGGFAGAQLNLNLLESPGAADINEDGIPDLVGNLDPFVITGGGLAVRLGNGDGTFQPDVILERTEGDLFAVADLNGDGVPDVAAAGTSGITVFLNASKPVAALTVVSAASFALGPLAPDSIAAAFGNELASGTSTTVSVVDSAGASRPAPLFFAGPAQINFLVPAATAIGPAIVSVTGTASGKTLTAQLQIAVVAPAIFSVGSNVTAAYAVHVTPGGAQTVVPISTPIDLTQPGKVYLVVFGTGFDSTTAASTFATIQGINATVTFAGPQPTYPGLDQINLLLPPSLAGTGVASVLVSMGGQTTNVTVVTIQ